MAQSLLKSMQPSIVVFSFLKYLEVYNFSNISIILKLETKAYYFFNKLYNKKASGNFTRGSAF
jgi:hypothetical protein